MDQAYSNALKRLKELEKQIQEVRQFLSLHKRFATTDSKRVKRKILNHASGKKPKEGGRPAVYADLMETILRRAARPMTRGELAEAVAREGWNIPSDDKARYLGTVLWRHNDRFENHEGKGYWLKGIRIPTSIGEQFDLVIGKPSVGVDR